MSKMKTLSFMDLFVIFLLITRKINIMSKNNKLKIQKLLNNIAQLRDPETGCAWDRTQSFDSMTQHTLEEAYEVIDAIDRRNMPDLKDELGDLLWHVVFYAQMASENGDFDFNDIVDNLNNKIMRRYPHVFGNQSAETLDDVNKIREEVKKAEREEKAKRNPVKEHGFKSVLDDVPFKLPALLRIYELDKKAAKAGFDWDDLEAYYPLVIDELQEIKEAVAENAPFEEIEMEVSDLITSTAILARKLKINPERALQKGCHKFIQRFQYIEKQAFKTEKPLNAYDVDQMMVWWRDAKKTEKQPA